MIIDLPPDLLAHLVRFVLVLEDGRSIVAMASTTRAMRDASLKAAGVTCIFELVVLAAVCRTDADDVSARIQLVQRALEAGHRAELFTWPVAAKLPLPSPLREHVCQWGGPVAHSLPLEYNLTVHISNPTDPDAAPFLPIRSIQAFCPQGNYWLPGNPVSSVHVNLDKGNLFEGDHQWVAPFGRAFQWCSAFSGQLCLGGKTQQASNINSNNLQSGCDDQCCRRMAFVLRPGHN